MQAAAGQKCWGIAGPMPFVQGANYAADKKRQALPVLYIAADRLNKSVLCDLLGLTGCPLACKGLQVTQSLQHVRSHCGYGIAVATMR